LEEPPETLSIHPLGTAGQSIAGACGSSNSGRMGWRGGLNYESQKYL